MIHSFLSSLFFIRPFKLSFVRLFIHYLQLQCKHDVYISSPYSPPPFDKEKSQQTKNTKKKPHKIKKSSVIALVAWNPVPCTVPIR